MSFTFDKLNELYAKACEVWDACPDVKEQEPYYIEIVEYIKRNKENRKLIAEWLLKKISPGSKEVGPPELFEFCMHALKWRELHDSIENFNAATNGIRARQFYMHILEAFSDKWDCRDMYSYFEK